MQFKTYALCKLQHVPYALSIAALLVAAVLSSRTASAQVLFGSVTGNVTDSSGAVVSGAKISALESAMGITQDTVADGVGVYRFAELLPGTWKITVSVPGFVGTETDNVIVTANNVVRVDMKVKVGEANVNVTVTTAPAQLQTETAETAYNIGEQQLAQLPTVSTTGRDFQALYRLIPGSTPPQEQNSQASNPQRSMASNQNGVSNSASATRIDGAVDQYPYLPVNVVYVPPTDAIESVNLVTSAFNAEQGIAGGAAINVILKSGTNQIHGSVFEYNSITQFNARGFFQTSAALPRLPKYIFNQYGGSVGGPIVKNKLFFFADWESTHLIKAVSGITSVPTAALRAGNFSATGTTIYDPTTGNPATGQGKTAFANQSAIPVSNVAAILLKNLPLPNYGAAGAQLNNYFGSTDQTLTRNNIDAKIDYNINQSNTLYGHYSIAPATVTDPQMFGENPGGGTWDGGQPGTGPDLVQMAVIDGTHTFTPHLLLDGDFGFTRLRVGAQAPDLALGDYGTSVLGIPGTNNNGQYLYGGIPAFTFVNYAGLGNTTSSNPFLFRDNQYAGNLNLSYTRDRHAFRFGAEYIHAAVNHFQPQQGSPRGTFTFNGSVASAYGTSGNNYTSFAEFLLGDPQSITKGVQSTNPIALRWSSYALYAEDTWQLGTKLTINYGMRYEYFSIPTHDHSTGPYEYLPQVPTTVTDSFGTHTVGTVFIGGKGTTPESAFISNGRGMIVPRLGIDYRVNDKMVLRSGFGISVDPENLENARNTYPAQIALSQSGANSYVQTTNYATGIPLITIPNLSLGEVPLPQNFSTYVFPTNFRRGYIESYNLAVERTLPASFVTDVAYVGTHAIRQIVDLDINAAPIGGGNAGRLLNTTYGANTSNAEEYLQDPAGSSEYNGLQAQLTRRSSPTHVSTGLVYTYSKSQDDVDNGQGTSYQFSYPAFLRYNYALAGYDRKHNIEWWSIAPSPFGKNGSYLRSGFAGALLGGWQFQSVMSYYSGTPFTVGASSSAINAPGNTQVADKVNSHTAIFGVHHLVNGSIVYFDPTNYAIPPGTRLGTSGRNSLRGPGVFELDAGLKRNFIFHDHYGLQLQAEAFNLTNTPNFGNPSGSSVSTPSTLGVITGTAGSSADNRQVRLSARITF
jgi:hypothetical protein